MKINAGVKDDEIMYATLKKINITFLYILTIVHTLVGIHGAVLNPAS